MIHKRVLLAGLFALAISTTSRGQSSPEGRAFVTYEPNATVTVKPGHSTPVAFTFHIREGYHINSSQPTREELIPTQLHFELPGDIAIGKVQYPPGQLVSFPFDPGQKLSVYSGDVTIRAVVVAPANAQRGAVTVHADLKYQPCDNNACYPPKKLPISFNVTVGSAGSKRPRNHEKMQSPHMS